MIRRIIFILILLGILSPSILASDLQFRRYSVEQGLPSNCIRDILQTEDGFIWLATDGGVVRFDGYKFKSYILSPGNKENDDNYAMALAYDHGILWVGTDSHLYQYDKIKDDFINYTFRNGNHTIDKLDVRGISFDHDGYMWLTVMNDGVYRIDNNQAAEHYDFPQFNNFVGNIFIDSKNNIWAVSNAAGLLMKWSPVENKFLPFGFEDINVPSIVITEDGNNNLWLGTWNEGLICFNPITGNTVYKTDEAQKKYFRHIHSVNVMPNGRIFVGSDAGLTVLDIVTGEIKSYVNQPMDVYSISDRFIYPIYLDREGGIWLGTFYGGLNYLSPDLKAFDRFEPTGQPNAIQCNIVSDLCEDRYGNIWIASDDGGLQKYDPRTRVFTKIELMNGDKGSISNGHTGNLHSLCFDYDNLWIGSYAAGVFVYNIKNGSCQHFSSSDADETSLKTNSSYAIFKDKRSVIWVASGSWINIYNRGSNNFRRLKDLKAQIIDICEDVDGSIWFATQGQGLWKYNVQKGDWHNYTYSADTLSLPHNHINNICLDSSNNLLFATVHGLCKFDRANDSFDLLNIGIPQIAVQSIVEDNGVYWLTTDLGLVKYALNTGCEVYTKSDGLSSGYFMKKSILKASDGKIYLGTRFGITAFYPYQIKSNQNIPSVMFTGIDIPNSIGHTPIHDNLNEIEKLVLNPEDYLFTLNFASLSFTNPEKNQYAYRLEGFDKDWIKVGAYNKCTYTNIPPGNYTFHVIASNGDNIWNEKGASLRIEVLAPWYWTWPMKALYLLLILIVAYLGVRMIMQRKDRKHSVEIRKINNDKELEVYQAKLSFFTMIAHEIRTPVSLIIGPLEKIMRSHEKVSPSLSRDLNIIERNSQRLLFLVNQLLDFKKVEETGIILKFRKTKIRSLISNVVERFRPSMEQKGIILEFKSTVDDDFCVDIDAEGVTKLLSNLLNNALKFTKDYVSITLSLDTANESVVIVVSDNGIGISKENQSKIFRPFYQVRDDNSQSKEGTGLGLSIVQSVVQGHKGMIKIDSTIDEGSNFIVILPIHQEILIDEDTNTDSISSGTEGKSEVNQNIKNKDKKPNILVVDDNEELCSFITNSFDDKYEVISANDGIEATEILKNKDITLVISDWMMPRMDGAELCKTVRNDPNISHIPFILLTAKTDNISRIEGLNIGADAYIDKPFSLQVLKARIDNILNMRAILRKKYSQQPLEPIESLAPTSYDNEILVKLNKIIEENFSNPDLDIDFLAAKLDISRSGLYNKIKSLIDVTPNELIRITRLKNAAKLLSQNKYRINEVCYMVGFNSTSYFAKCFQKQFGMTPKEFIGSINPHSHPCDEDDK